MSYTQMSFYQNYLQSNTIEKSVYSLTNSSKRQMQGTHIYEYMTCRYYVQTATVTARSRL